MKCSFWANAASKMASRWLVTRRPFWARNFLNFSRAVGMLTARTVVLSGGRCQFDPSTAHWGIARGTFCQLNRKKTRMFVGVHPLAGFDKVLHYRVPEALRGLAAVGSLVRIPVGHATRLGVIGGIGPPQGLSARAAQVGGPDRVSLPRPDA